MDGIDEIMEEIGLMENIEKAGDGRQLERFKQVLEDVKTLYKLL